MFIKEKYFEIVPFEHTCGSYVKNLAHWKYRERLCSPWKLLVLLSRRFNKRERQVPALQLILITNVNTTLSLLSAAMLTVLLKYHFRFSPRALIISNKYLPPFCIAHVISPFYDVFMYKFAPLLSDWFGFIVGDLNHSSTYSFIAFDLAYICFVSTRNNAILDTVIISDPDIISVMIARSFFCQRPLSDFS